MQTDDFHLHVVKQIIEDARRRGRVELADVFHALHEIQSDRYDHPNQTHALRLADALRTVLTVREFAGLCFQAKRQFSLDAGDAVSALSTLEERAGKRVTELSDDETTRIADFTSEKSGWEHSQLILEAVIVQTLKWVVLPPADSMPYPIS
jgi:hypothetical protein